MSARSRERNRRMVARLDRQIRIGFARRIDRRVRVAVWLWRGGTGLCAVCALVTCAWDGMVLSGGRSPGLFWWWAGPCDALGLAATVTAVCLACAARVSWEDL